MAKRHKANGTVFYVCTDDGCSLGQHSDRPVPLDSKPDHPKLTVFPWSRRILTTKTPATARKMANRIKKVAPEESPFSCISGDKLSKLLADPSFGYLELRPDSFGNKRYLPTEMGTASGIGIGSTTLGGKKADIALFEKNAQQEIIRRLSELETLINLSSN